MKYTKNLTLKQKRVWDYINSYLKEYSVSPTIEEIQDSLGFRSTRSVSQYLEALRDKGYITKNRNARSIELLDPSESVRATTALIPLLGMASCGTPEFFADNNIEEYLPVDNALIKNTPSEYYLLKTSGTSMNKAGINDNSLVLIQKQIGYEQGDRVVAVIDDKATIKKLYKGDGAIMLSPASTDDIHKPIIATEGAICGRVVCVVPM
ncbi:MAG TPA: transcriptional repressor LexA [bacterium]|jgi:repressor LexA|nr:transcriptional repressor LexA [bacterium]